MHKFWRGSKIRSKNTCTPQTDPGESENDKILRGCPCRFCCTGWFTLKKLLFSFLSEVQKYKCWWPKWSVVWKVVMRTTNYSFTPFDDSLLEKKFQLDLADHTLFFSTNFAHFYHTFFEIKNQLPLKTDSETRDCVL